MFPPCSNRLAQRTHGSGGRAFVHSGFMTKLDSCGFHESHEPLNSQDSNFILHLRRSFQSPNSPLLAMPESHNSLYCGHPKILHMPVQKRCQYPSGLTFSSLLTGSKMNCTQFIAERFTKCDYSAKQVFCILSNAEVFRKP
jgi:hypothetical protein